MDIDNAITIYIYIERERDRETLVKKVFNDTQETLNALNNRERGERERDRERERETERERVGDRYVYVKVDPEIER